MELIKITKENPKKKPTFEEILRIIKKGDTNVVYKVDFTLDILGQDYRKAVLKLDIDGEDDYSLVLEDGMISFHLNEKTLFTIDEEYTYNWLDFINKKFIEQFPDNGVSGKPTKILSDEFENEVLKINNVLHSIKVLNDNSQDNLWEIDKLRTKEQLTELEQKNLNDSMRQNFRNSFAINELLEVLKDTRIRGGDYTEYSNVLFKHEALKVS